MRLRNQLGAWILVSGALTLTAWKCEQGYTEYRSISNAIDSLAAACKTAGESSPVVPLDGRELPQVCPSVRSNLPPAPANAAEQILLQRL